MTTAKKQLLDQTFEAFLEECIFYKNPEILRAITDDSLTGFGTTIFEKVTALKDLETILNLQVEQTKGVKVSYKTTPFSRHISLDENTAIMVDELTMSFGEGVEAFHIYVRISAVLEYKTDKWLVVHWHASLPEKVESKEDIWGFEALKQKTVALEKEIAERTAEILEKNKELEIEVALEKVRSRSMAMQSTEDLAVVSALLDSEVRGLGIATRGCAFNIYGENDSSEWFSSEMGTLPTYKTPREHIFKTYYEARENGEKLLVKEFDEKTCPAHYDFLCTVPVMGDALKQMIASGGSFPKRQIDHVAFFKYGYLLFITLEQVPEEHDIFIRFANAFEQTYTRFLDLQKAEAQVKDAQIEAALERVRSRSMAMQKSEELREVILLLLKTLPDLGISMKNRATGIFTYEEGNKDYYQWAASPEYNSIISFLTPYIDHPVQNDIWNARQNGTEFYAKSYTVQEKNSLFKFFFELPALKNMPLKDKKRALGFKYYDVAIAFEQNSAIVVVSHSGIPLTEDENEILRRFAKVFEQTYIRFLDLQKAEAQTREAKIEAALEKVRSVALSLKKSDELLDVAEVLYHQLFELGFNNIRNVIIDIHIDDKGGFLDYDYSPEMGKSVTLMSYNDHPIIDKQVKEIHTSKDGFFEIILEGNDLQELIDLRIKNGEKEDLRLNQIEQLTYNLYSFGKGEIGISTFGLLKDDQKNLLKRFRNVFTFAYKRYNDLKQAEELAKQAQIDLENLIIAKKKTDDALIELKETQSQLIQSEKMASLGELTAGIAHEIQNPLNFVNNFSEVSNELLAEIQEERLKNKEIRDEELVSEILDDIKQNLEKINHHGKRADAIVKGMLQHSRSSSGTKEPTDINKLSDEYLRLAYHGLRAKDKSFNASLVTNYDENIGKINIIPQDIGRVILNLITNAFYATNEKQKSGIENYEPTITLTTKKIVNSVEISVKDNANGIPAKVLDKIFQPFFTTKPTGQGTGLGLSLAYDIVKAHGGEMKVTTEENVGTEFSIIIPT